MFSPLNILQLTEVKRNLEYICKQASLIIKLAPRETKQKVIYIPCTVIHGYSEHCYNELMLTVM